MRLHTFLKRTNECAGCNFTTVAKAIAFTKTKPLFEFCSNGPTYECVLYQQHQQQNERTRERVIFTLIILDVYARREDKDNGVYNKLRHEE